MSTATPTPQARTALAYTIAANTFGPIPPTPENIRAALSYISPDMPHADWWKVCAAIKNALNGEGFDLFDEWSQTGQTYKAADTRATWKSTKGAGGVTVGTLWGMALEAGWKPDKGAHQETEAERMNRKRKRQAWEAKCKADEAKERENQEKAASKAVAILDAATGDPAKTAYAQEKGVPLGDRVRCGDWRQRRWSNALLIPLEDAMGKVWSVEAINANGDKDFLSGGRVSGCFHPFGEVRGAGRVLVGEGPTTVKAAHDATGLPAVAAMSAGNLEAVALAVRSIAAPGAEIVFLADDDQKPGTDQNPGIEAATKAARAVGGLVAIPAMGRKADFWDLWNEQGPDAVREALANAFIPKPLAGQDQRQSEPEGPPAGWADIPLPDDDGQRNEPRRGFFGGPLRDPGDVGGKKKTAAKPHAEPPKIITASALSRIKFEPLRWIIPGILPEGVALLVGAPKIGKSWVCLDWCIAVASGGDVFGSIAGIEPGESFYLALEDNERRIQRRLSSRLRDTAHPERMHITCNWPRMNEGGVDLLRRWLEEHPGCRLVVIDTLAMFRPPTSANKGVYEQDHAFGTALLKLASDFKCAIAIVHHNNKSKVEDVLETISGSQGLAGGVDNIIVMRRPRFTDGAELHVTGRDIEDEQVYQLAFDKVSCAWQLSGSGREVLLSPELKSVVDLLKGKERLSGKEVTQLLHPGLVIVRDSKEWATCRKRLEKLAGLGFITKDGAKYTYKDQSHSSHIHTVHTVHTVHTEQTQMCEQRVNGERSHTQPNNDAGYSDFSGVCERVNGVNDAPENDDPENDAGRV